MSVLYFRFARRAQKHERRRAFDRNDVALLGGEIGDVLLVGRIAAAVFLTRALGQIEENRNDADALGQQLDHVDEGGTSRPRLYVADDAAVVRGFRQICEESKR